MPLRFHNPDQEYLCFCSFRALISLGLIQYVRYLECLVRGDSSVGRVYESEAGGTVKDTKGK